MKPPAPRKFAPRLAAAALLVVGAAACSRSKPLAPPTDLAAEASLDTLKQLLSQPSKGADFESGHQIEQGDTIEVRLVGRDDVMVGSGFDNGEVVVTESPYLTFPLVGAIKVHGRTAAQLMDDLKVAYREYIIDPRPSVILKKIVSNQVAVLGAVRQPGKYPLVAGDLLQDAVLKAGGMGAQAQSINVMVPGRYLIVYREKKDVGQKVQRSLDDLMTRLGQGESKIPREEIRVPIEDYLLTGNLAYNIPIQPLDIIYVPAAGSVTVHGWVNDPGVQQLGPSLRTLNQVITARKDMRFGAKSIVQVQRKGADGQLEVTRLDARAILNREASDFVLQDGDEIFVDYTPWRVVLGFVGEIFKSGTRAGVSATYNPAAGAI